MFNFRLTFRKCKILNEVVALHVHVLLLLASEEGGGGGVLVLVMINYSLYVVYSIMIQIYFNYMFFTGCSFTGS